MKHSLLEQLTFNPVIDSGTGMMGTFWASGSFAQPKVIKYLSLLNQHKYKNLLFASTVTLMKSVIDTPVII